MEELFYVSNIYNIITFMRGHDILRIRAKIIINYPRNWHIILNNICSESIFAMISILLFSRHQTIFSITFLICFVIFLIWAYRSDAEINRRYYKNVWVILLSIAAIVAGIIILSKLLH